MKNGLAIWHYPHRTLVENVRYFSQRLDSVSVLGFHFLDACRLDGGAALYEALCERRPVFTVHHKLPSSHDAEDVEGFNEEIALCAHWQKQYGLLTTLSFDVPQDIRDNIYPYLRTVLQAFEGEKTRIAIEDFGLTNAEMRQLEPLRGNERFGFLLDIGHLTMRLNDSHWAPGKTLFNFSRLECPSRELGTPVTRADCREAIASKPFPIVEIHMHTNDGVRDMHWFLDEPGGVVDVQMMADLLNELHYDDVLTIESAPGFMFKCAGQAADEGIERTILLWESCLKRAGSDI